MNLPWRGAQRKKTRQLGGAVLGSEAPIVLFAAVGARALVAADGDSGAASAYLWIGLFLAVALIVTAGLLRRPYGVTLGWGLQALTILSGVVVPAMFPVGLIFLGLWVVALLQGPRLDDMTEQYLREHPDEA